MFCLKDLPFALDGFWRVWQGSEATCTESSYQESSCALHICSLPLPSAKRAFKEDPKLSSMAATPQLPHHHPWSFAL